MFCGGSLRSKTIEENDEYKIVKVNNTHIKIFRSNSFISSPSKSAGRKIFVVPPKPLKDTPKRICFAPEKVSHAGF